MLDWAVGGPHARGHSGDGSAMKRVLSFVVGAFGVALLGGCPIYGSGGGNCSVNSDCGSGGMCVDGTCQPNNSSQCTSPSQCPSGSTCNSSGFCESGNCTQTGCVSGYSCVIQNGTASCVATTDGGPPPYSGCFSDSDCTGTGAGSKCLNSVCTAPANQCADATQCAANEQCVQGVCTPSCSSTVACPSGYSCDLTNGVCTGNPNPCTLGGNQCTGGTVCVQQHCDTACGPNNACSNGLVCINGGCMPNQKPNFICNTEGVQDNCAAGSICLRHECYISCSPSDPNACKTADQFNICKSVTTSTGTYNVCGSSTNLGNQCDPTQGLNCPNSGICIDGYCH